MRLMPKADPTVSAKTPVPTMWVLLQLHPHVDVLGASENRNRLVAEMAELYGHDADAGRKGGVRFAVRPTDVLFG